MFNQIEKGTNTIIFIDPKIYSDPKLLKDLIDKIKKEKTKPFQKVFVHAIAPFSDKFFEALKDNSLPIKQSSLNKLNIVVEI